MIGIGVIGYGYWGPNLVRNFMEVDGATVIAVSDLQTERLARLNARYPSIETTTDYRDLLKHSKIHAVIVATPVSSHFNFAMEALKANKHVLVEKPLAATSVEARYLIEE